MGKYTILVKMRCHAEGDLVGIQSEFIASLPNLSDGRHHRNPSFPSRTAHKTCFSSVSSLQRGPSLSVHEFSAGFETLGNAAVELNNIKLL